MTSCGRRATLLAVLGMFLGLSGSASAGLMQGQHVQVQETFRGKLVPGSTRSFTVNGTRGTPEVTHWGPSGHFSLDFFDFRAPGESGLMIKANTAGQFGRGPDILTITDPRLPHLTSIHVAEEGDDLSWVGWGWRIHTAPGSLSINLGGIHFATGSYALFDLRFGSKLPPPPAPRAAAQPMAFAAVVANGANPQPPVATPEPNPLWLLALGGGGCLGGYWWSRRGKGAIATGPSHPAPA
jgi:hypothetical protein